ncbi:MAG: hypothetical protein ACRCYX_06045 [Dermatophilaceae bacterium]
MPWPAALARAEGNCETCCAASRLVTSAALIPPEDAAAVDRYLRPAGITSRSAGIQRAIRQLTQSEPDDAYAAA